MHLYIHVALGNEEMLSGEDVVKSLQHNRLNASDPTPLQVGEVGKVYDVNGNVVGDWIVQEDSGYCM